MLFWDGLYHLWVMTPGHTAALEAGRLMRRGHPGWQAGMNSSSLRTAEEGRNGRVHVAVGMQSPASARWLRLAFQLIPQHLQAGL